VRCQRGGRQTIYTAALNWYVSGNARFMFDYLHGTIAKQITPSTPGMPAQISMRLRCGPKVAF